ncbi:hypothetical protein JM16_006416 [Phytophthora kernoviae]|uniref:Uncharacterized protein n=1 Tax=Phytophthora kernoviae TaxID=325452 RepID=A0A8T0LSZ4_9STRA|nr:hypothetical protein JM16_006416 [Phytophthora kernoviae]
MQDSATKPKKKRIRRQKLELDYLRDLVVKLEDQMTQLNTRQNEPEDGKDKEETDALTGIKRFKPLLDTVVTPTDDDIFADQLAHVQRAHLEADQLFSGPEYANRSIVFCDMHVMNDPNSDVGVAFVTKANCMLPFDLHVTEKAFWRSFVGEGTTDLCYFLDDRISTDDLVARSYGLHFDADSFHINARGKQTFRKYVGDNCVMLMWKAISEPVEINGTKFYGLRVNQTVWIVLRGVNLEDTADTPVKTECSGDSIPRFNTSTSLQSYSKMTLELQDDIVDQELQVGALTDFVVNSHDTISEVCGKMINKVLVEEDWNLNGWLDNIAL